MSNLPNIPVEDLFQEIEFPDANKIPFRWWNVKTAREYLGVSERTIRRYIEAGKLEIRRKTVKGHIRVYVSNLSVIDLADNRKWKREQKELQDDEQEDDNA